jgi:hypothetical protein
MSWCRVRGMLDRLCGLGFGIWGQTCHLARMTCSGIGGQKAAAKGASKRYSIPSYDNTTLVDYTVQNNTSPMPLIRKAKYLASFPSPPGPAGFPCNVQMCPRDLSSENAIS